MRGTGEGPAARRRQGLTRTLRGLIALSLVGVLALAVPHARGVPITGPGFSADVSATVTPNRLPQHGAAPVDLAVAGTIAAGPAGASAPLLSTLDLILDRQIGIETTGLPTCTFSDVTHTYPKQARKRCGKALIGSGTVTDQVMYPDAPPFDLHDTVLFFNAPAKGVAPQILMYWYIPPPLGPATALSRTAGDPSLQFQFNGGVGVTTAFRFHFGKTWTHKGQKFSYLSGRCANGKLSNRMVLTLRNGQKQSGTVPEHCEAQ